jgi:hypothetical protein
MRTHNSLELFLAMALGASAQPLTMTVDASKTGPPIGSAGVTGGRMTLC